MLAEVVESLVGVDDAVTACSDVEPQGSEGARPIGQEMHESCPVAGGEGTSVSVEPRGPRLRGTVAA
jgi:hypothetical protein